MLTINRTIYAFALILILASPLCLATEVYAAERGGETTLTDVAGRSITIALPVKTMILGEGRFLPTIGILERENPTRRVVAMMGEFKKYDPATFAQYLAAFPEMKDIPLIGAGTADSFSVEDAIMLQPDVTVFGLGGNHGPGDKDKEIIDRLEKAGIPVVFIDFRQDPFVNTPKSLHLLAKLLGREDEAEAFLTFYETELTHVEDRMRELTKRPTVFMEMHAGAMDGCCHAAGNSMMGRFISKAGGDNIMAEKIPGTFGTTNLEYLLATQPRYYVATASGNNASASADSKRIVLGVGTSEDAARDSLKRSLGRVGLGELDAVKNDRVISIWHHFYNTPMNVVALQALSKMFHPDLFQDLDPRATLATYFERFQPVDLDGHYWISAGQ